MLAATTDRTLAGLKAVERRIGTTAQQRPLLDGRLRAAQAAATGEARAVLDTIVAWDGDYDRQDAGGTVDPGVAAYEALKEAVEDTLPAAAVTLLGQRGGSHPFDMGAAEAEAFHRSSTAQLVTAAGAAARALATRFGTADPAAWREPRKLYDVQVPGRRGARRGSSSSTAGRSRRPSSSGPRGRAGARRWAAWRSAPRRPRASARSV